MYVSAAGFLSTPSSNLSEIERVHYRSNSPILLWLRKFDVDPGVNLYTFEVEHPLIQGMTSKIAITCRAGNFLVFWSQGSSVYEKRMPYIDVADKRTDLSDPVAVALTVLRSRDWDRCTRRTTLSFILEDYRLVQIPIAEGAIEYTTIDYFDPADVSDAEEDSEDYPGQSEQEY